MNSISKAIILLGLLIVVSTGSLIFFKGFSEDQADALTKGTSDAKNIIGKITLATDDWEGYSSACSKEMHHLLANKGYLLECINDGGAYDERYQSLAAGEVDLAFGTIDSYLSVGEKYKYPGVIISVVDESKGGDAILSKRFKSFKDIKNKTVSVSFVKDSPSQFLWSVVAKNFGIKYKDYPTSSPKEAYDLMTSGKVDFSVLWQPFVNSAISDGYNKIVGSESINGLIVDILIANRESLDDDKEKIMIFLSEYYAYMKNKLGTTNTGIKLYGINDNKHFYDDNFIVDSIVNISNILNISLDNPYSLINSAITNSIVDNSKSLDSDTYLNIKDQLENIYSTTSFSKLSDSQWEYLAKVGNLKVEQIKFKSGSSLLTLRGKEELDNIGRIISQYNYRVKIIGHSSLDGDEEINLELSKDRAKSVENYLVRISNVNSLQVKSIGVGIKRPLKRIHSESWRNYNKRLQRVEFVFLTE